MAATSSPVRAAFTSQAHTAAASKDVRPHKEGDSADGGDDAPAGDSDRDRMTRDAPARVRQPAPDLSLARAGAVLLLALVAAPGAATAQGSPSQSVFQLVVMRNEGFREYRSVTSGTGFFIAPDGTALTNSHVVAQVVKEPRTYSLLAILGKEFFGATVVCASKLPAERRDGTAPWSRDVAIVRLTNHPPFAEDLTYNDIVYARVHLGPLPPFPALRMATDPESGDHVRILGFGRIKSPLPYEWSASGTVMGLRKAADGTTVFEMHYDRGAVPGHSGSPVLNDRDEVVGMEAWGNPGDALWGGAIAVSALTPPCQEEGSTK
jgi:Trypsin-like peptidase domain